MQIKKQNKKTTTAENSHSTHLVVLQGNAHDELRSYAKKGRIDGWTATQQFAKGDLAFFYLANPFKSIVAIGVIESEPWTEDGPFDWTDKDRATFCDYSPVWWLPKPLPLSEAKQQSKSIELWHAQLPYRSTRIIPGEVASEILMLLRRGNSFLKDVLPKRLVVSTDKVDTSIEASNTIYEEGAVRELVAELSFRDRQLREDAIRVKGCVCEVCGFDFESFYGEIGAGFVEVHHLRPLSKNKGQVRKTSLKDVSVVCPNCHRMLHRNGAEPLSIGVLKKAIESNGRNRSSRKK